MNLKRKEDLLRAFINKFFNTFYFYQKNEVMKKQLSSFIEERTMSKEKDYFENLFCFAYFQLGNIHSFYHKGKNITDTDLRVFIINYDDGYKSSRKTKINMC